MLALIVLIHNQAVNLPRLLPAYEGLETQPDLFVFVLDRCTDTSKDVLQGFGTNHHVAILDVEGYGFQAGRNRDIGAAEAERQLGPCDFVFLDGDCVPTPALLTGFVEVFKSAGSYPAAVVGRRVNETESGGLAEDNRMRITGAAKRVFAADMHRLVVSRAPLFSRLCTWSCCLGVNAVLASLLRQVNTRVDKCATIFNDGFNGRWGGEDDFLGMTAWYLGAAVVSLNPGRCHVRHIYHKSRENVDYIHTMSRRTGQLRRLATRLRMPGVVFAKTQVSIFADEIARDALVSDPAPIHDLLLRGHQYRIPFWQVLGAHCAVTGSLRKVQGGDISAARIALEKFEDTAVDALSVLGNLKYTYKLPHERACSICGSEKGYTADGCCLHCRAQPWHRLAKAILRGRSYGLAINPEPRGEQMMLRGWEHACYRNGVNLEELPYPTSSFDIVHCGHTLEHVRNDAKAIAEIARVLKPSGSALLSFPTRNGRTDEDLSDALTPLERKHRFYWHDHYRVYGLRDVIKRLEDNGLLATPVWAADFADIPGVHADELVFVCMKRKDAQ